MGLRVSSVSIGLELRVSVIHWFGCGVIFDLILVIRGLTHIVTDYTQSKAILLFIHFCIHITHTISIAIYTLFSTVYSYCVFKVSKWSFTSPWNKISREQESGESAPSSDTSGVTGSVRSASNNVTTEDTIGYNHYQPQLELQQHPSVQKQMEPRQQQQHNHNPVSVSKGESTSNAVSSAQSQNQTATPNRKGRGSNPAISSSNNTQNNMSSASSSQRNADRQHQQPQPQLEAQQLSCQEPEDHEEPPLPSATPSADLRRLTTNERLERAYSMPVVFALKALLAYDGDLDQDSPLPGRAVRFRSGDFLHVKEVRALVGVCCEEEKGVEGGCVNSVRKWSYILH